MSHALESKQMNRQSIRTYPTGLLRRTRPNTNNYPYGPGRKAIDESQGEVCEAVTAISLYPPCPSPSHIWWWSQRRRRDPIHEATTMRTYVGPGERDEVTKQKDVTKENLTTLSKKKRESKQQSHHETNSQLWFLFLVDLGFC